MASKSFALNTEPHRAEIGSHVLEFVPEANGSLFASSYSNLKEAQKVITAAGDNVGAAELTVVADGMREFLVSFMLPESAKLFDTMELPTRVLVQLIEWTAELFGGGSGNGDGGSSSAN